MIKTKEELREYLDADSKNFWHLKHNCIKRMYFHLFVDTINDQTVVWQYIYTLRHVEYYSNTSGLLSKILKILYLHRLRKLGRKTGFQIAPNTCDKGLTIWHWGPIIINSKAKIGEYCTLRPPVIIGETMNGESPTIGDNVVINGFTSIVGGIHVGNNVVIAPNSAVVKNIPSNVIVGGVPSKVIKER